MVRRRSVLAATIGAGVATGFAAPPVTADAAPSLAAAGAALRRLLGRHADQIELRRLAGRTDRYRVDGRDGRLVVAATSGATALAGVQRYLGTLSAGIWWTADNLALPRRLPAPVGAIEATAVVPHRFAGNDTYEGYTDPNAGFEAWRRDLDVLAAHGFNEVLIGLGTDAVYLDTLRSFGYSAAELLDWIPGPAHQPWWLLQNMSGFGGPMSAGLVHRRAALAARVIDHVRSLGMTPVLPGYFGTVPPDFAARNPAARVVPQGRWCGFDRPGWLDPRGSVFADVAAAFYANQAHRFGPATMYKMDLLHEGGSAGDVPVGEASRAVERALRRARPGATWVILGWQRNPLPATIAAVDRSKMLIVDGLAERSGAVDRERDWSNTPYAFGTIYNYGGKSTLGGAAATWVDKYHRWRGKPNGALAGIALMPEANRTSDANLDLFGALGWRTDRIDLPAYYADYARRRYGAADRHAEAAWAALRGTAYAIPGDSAEPQDGLFGAQPSLTATSGAAWSPSTVQYDPSAFDAALPALLAVAPRLRTGAAYRSDLVDVARQTIDNRGRLLLPQLYQAYTDADLVVFDQLAAAWLALLDLLADLVATRPELLLGPRLATARAAGGDEDEADRLEFDQRSLLTVWGGRTASVDGGLRDYANREWTGWCVTCTGRAGRATWPRCAPPSSPAPRSPGTTGSPTRTAGPAGTTGTGRPRPATSTGPRCAPTARSPAPARSTSSSAPADAHRSDRGASDRRPGPPAASSRRSGGGQAAAVAAGGSSARTPRAATRPARFAPMVDADGP
nr:alpha-N-acetylglucosaminidase TIM-barrel domain-containing protein [Actinocatenispora thailandica]